MIQYLNVFFYDIYPYLCGTVFLVGSWLRYDYGQYTGAPHPARCWISAGWCYGRTYFISAFSASSSAIFLAC
ncbi:respiratory nitrate reductase subunit gamma [Klebsiella pneumoniae subsp. pneumoniae]|nr:respiratory nitrate reductase subunit gamma [Klebsiella pneumoniae subsp. pneumoniae]